MQHHGFVILRAFYEWVAVADLLKTGVVTINDVQAEFSKQMLERKARLEASGKKYKPTPTELKDPRFRQIIIEFKPEVSDDLLVPVIFSEQMFPNGEVDRGFAIVTDDPLPEISAAGHDRSPVFLEPSAIQEWLHFQGKSSRQLDGLLTKKQNVIFKFRLPEAA
jgi:hypothetical protein